MANAKVWLCDPRAPFEITADTGTLSPARCADISLHAAGMGGGVDMESGRSSIPTGQARGAVQADTRRLRVQWEGFRDGWLGSGLGRCELTVLRLPRPGRTEVWRPCLCTLMPPPFCDCALRPSSSVTALDAETRCDPLATTPVFDWATGEMRNQLGVSAPALVPNNTVRVNRIDS